MGGQLMRTRVFAILPVFALLLPLGAPNAHATVRYANPDGSCGMNAPCSTNLQDAITASMDGDVIQVQPGLFVLTVPVDVAAEVTILGPQVNVNPLPSKGSARIPGDTATEADSPDAAIYVYDASETLIEGNLVYLTTSNDGIMIGTGVDLSAPSPNGPVVGACGEAPVPASITTWGRIKARYR
jgi:hypothetical protein